MPTSNSSRGSGMRGCLRSPEAYVIFFGLIAASPVLGAERFEGLVEPYLEVKISSGVPGILDEVLVQRGDYVKKDQVLARLQSDVEKATCDLTRAKAEFAARKAKRNQELAKRQMISSNDKDELETEAQILQLELKEMEARLKQRTITSPVNGVVVKRSYSPGAVVKVVDPVVDAASGTIGIRLELPNPKHELPAGTKCWVRFPIAAEHPAPKVDPGRPKAQTP